MSTVQAWILLGHKHEQNLKTSEMKVIWINLNTLYTTWVIWSVLFALVGVTSIKFPLFKCSCSGRTTLFMLWERRPKCVQLQLQTQLIKRTQSYCNYLIFYSNCSGIHCTQYITSLQTLAFNQWSFKALCSEQERTVVPLLFSTMYWQPSTPSIWTFQPLPSTLLSCWLPCRCSV